jgi:hypothetical protein
VLGRIRLFYSSRRLVQLTRVNWLVEQCRGEEPKDEGRESKALMLARKRDQEGTEELKVQRGRSDFGMILLHPAHFLT